MKVGNKQEEAPEFSFPPTQGCSLCQGQTIAFYQPLTRS